MCPMRIIVLILSLGLALVALVSSGVLREMLPTSWLSWLSPAAKPVVVEDSEEEDDDEDEEEEEERDAAAVVVKRRSGAQARATRGKAATHADDADADSTDIASEDSEDSAAGAGVGASDGGVVVAARSERRRGRATSVPRSKGRSVRSSSAKPSGSRGTRRHTAVLGAAASGGDGGTADGGKEESTMSFVMSFFDGRYLYKTYKQMTC